MRIKAAPNRLVRDPITRLRLPEGGIEVSDSDPFWVRRLTDGDVVRVVAPPALPVPKVKE